MNSCRVYYRFELSCLPAILSFVFIFQVSAQQETIATKPVTLTIERIFGQPDLSGELDQGVMWAPDNHSFTFLENRGGGKLTKSELWQFDALTGELSMLISSDRLEKFLSLESNEPSETIGTKRQSLTKCQWAPTGSALLLVSPHRLAWHDLKSQTTRILVSDHQELSDAKVSPDGKYISFVREHNLWLVNIADGKERSLSTNGTEEIRKGELDWTYLRELGLSTGYWWSPDSKAIAFLELDERKVTNFPFADSHGFTGAVEMQRYPLGGSSIPVARILVVHLVDGKLTPVDIGTDTEIYIPRVQWLPDSRHLAVQRLNRPQTNLDLLLSDPTSGKSNILLSEKDLYWINVSDDLHFLKDSRRFLWSSERSGYRHLFLYDLTGRQLAQLTKGDWEVTRVAGLDESKGIVYFNATEKSPLEHHLYRTGLDGSGFKRITKEDGTHLTNLSADAEIFLDTYSNTSTPPRQDFYRADGKKLTTLKENKVPELAAMHLSPVEFFTIKSHDGILLNCSMIKPPDFDPSKKYPVLIFTNGGPHVQVVVNAWTGSTYLWHELMAQKGYIIFSVDNRGSGGRGHLFEEPIHYRFGALELSDQRDGGEWLKHQPFVDGERIGIWGWGYGGHMTLHAVFQMPQMFKVGFAGSPVTDWHFYNAAYTERYIGLLPLHEESYQESSPIKSAEKFKGKLLLAHGTGDDTVHYCNTLALIDELIEAGKYIEVMTFPGRGHDLNDPPAERVLWNRVTQFFLNNL
jgi:dipeptidyl-peptidase-4